MIGPQFLYRITSPKSGLVEPFSLANNNKREQCDCSRDQSLLKRECSRWRRSPLLMVLILNMSGKSNECH